MSRSKFRASGKRVIAAVTSSRSDYAHLRWLLHDLARNPKLDLRIIALGPHFSPEFGHSIRQLQRDRLPEATVVECLLSSDTDIGMAKTLGVATLGLAEVLGKMRPDLLLLIADRYEMLAPASVALTLRIPIAHIEGGEITAGAIDDAVRNAITKMAHLHFACTRRAAKRIVAMGEEPWRVTFSGSLSLDELQRSRLPSTRRIEKTISGSLQDDYVLALYHPVTLLKDSVAEAAEMLAALERVPNQVIFIYPNADAGSREIIRLFKKFISERGNAKLLINLEHLTYLSLLSHSGILVGNSSSGVIESTSLGIPTLNIGLRQQGREHAANVIDVPAERRAILAEIKRALSPQFRERVRKLENPYGDGHAAKRIMQVLEKTPLGEELLLKMARARA
jgi:UDP-hydrolysing UDP-N-acetyl-D-glucosamine 2-epimerase